MTRPALARTLRLLAPALLAVVAGILVGLTDEGGTHQTMPAVEAVAVQSSPQPPLRAAPPAATAAPRPPAPLVCIDPGHSLAVPGMSVEVGERVLTEVEINIDVALAVTAWLRQRFGDHAVVLTWGEQDGLPRAWNALRGPEADEREDVIARGRFCSARGARAIVSVHTNWFGDAPNGTLTGYRDDDDRVLAEAVHRAMLESFSFDTSGQAVEPFEDYGLDQGDWFLSLGADTPVNLPVVILEPVMMSDPEEARRLLPAIQERPNGRRAQIARVEAEAVAAYLEELLQR